MKDCAHKIQNPWRITHKNRQNNEKIIKLQHFFSVDTKIKKEIYDIAPQSLNGYIDETSISEYTDKLNDSLIYILSELKCVALDVFDVSSLEVSLIFDSEFKLLFI